jgi:O-methyltransferase
MASPVADMYVDLLMKSVLEELYVENEVRLLYLRFCIVGMMQFDPMVFLDVRGRLPDMVKEYEQYREYGLNYDNKLFNLGFQHTMIGRRRLDNVRDALETILKEGLDGDVIECGVWRGGACVLMRGFLKAHGDDRNVWLADSFDGLPAPTHEADTGYDISKDKCPQLAITLEMVEDLFRRYDLLDPQVKFLKGWFKDTLPGAPLEKISLLRLDGDLYESTMDAIVPLYDKVVPGGFIIVDDYGVLPPCRKAIHDFADSRNLQLKLIDIDRSGVYWRKE